MKEAILSVSKDAAVDVSIIDSPIPKPGPDEVQIKVAAVAMNPKDWKSAMWNQIPNNAGDDIAGIISAVGEGILNFTVGQRVAALHPSMTRGGGFAEYAIAPALSTFHIPDSITFQDAATVPLAGMTAAIGLHLRMSLPTPFMPAPETQKTPLVVYGAASAVGAFAVKLAVLSGIHPIICISGRGAEFVSSLIDTTKGDAVVDYRKGDEAIASDIRKALAAAGCPETVDYVFDAISEAGSHENIDQIISNAGVVMHVHEPDGYKKFGIKEAPERFTRTPSFRYKDGVRVTTTMVNDIFQSHQYATGDVKDFGFVFSRYFGWLLEEGKLEPHPCELVPGGLGGIKQAQEKLIKGEASAVKYVVRIEVPNELSG
ncbi:putative alcohol dehydrogenase-like protein [Phaeomoniella chlamydospora]|uniref:Putative alcohol dehydrogenase-like protein n=1 Tax=Phaeomoniella chlamydospora TaxID=158046 RepID=A0A0G2EEX4_PHACM|nr:putative alcohol dehydrogenase-like protein [Phaeomoniella chlamydospora]